MYTRRTILATLAATLATPAFAGSPPVFADSDGIAINGYDAVAYFTQSEPISGDPQMSFKWNGATWLFATSRTREMFVTDPEAYAPQFGGYCALAASKGAIAPTIPDAWTIYEGKLYLNFNLRARDIWRQDIPGNVAKAEANWPAILN